MQLFVLNGVDYTQHIVVPSYKVQREPVTKTWEDATYSNHVDFIRWRIKGTFRIYFETVEEFDHFLNELTNMRDTDYYTRAKFYDNDTRQLVDSRYIIKFTFANDKPYYGIKKHDGYDIQIEEQ